MRQRTEESFIEAEHVDGEPAIALPHAGRGAKDENDDRGEEDLALGIRVQLIDHAKQHGDHNRHGNEKDQFLVVRHAAEPEPRHNHTEGRAAAKNAPVDRFDGDIFQPHQQRAQYRYGGHAQPEQEHGLVGIKLRQQAAEARHGKYAERQSQPAQNLDHAEIMPDVGFRPRASIFVFAIHHFSAHGVRHHILEHDADDDQQFRRDVEHIEGKVRIPAARGPGEDQQPNGNQRCPGKHVYTTLRPEQGHRIHDLPEHHLDGPGQRQPDAERGEAGRRHVKRLLDPEAFGNADQPQRAIGKIDHEERQIAQPHRLNRRDQRRLEALGKRARHGR